MTMPTMEAIERVRNCEHELGKTQRYAGRVLRSARRKLKMSMQAVADEMATISPATIHNTEKAKFWKTNTAERLAKFYDQKSAA
jgi:ribosome-binding protein aMBF1 (putative translation factor)